MAIDPVQKARKSWDFSFGCPDVLSAIHSDGGAEERRAEKRAEKRVEKRAEKRPEWPM
jgi:hypothetical protein